MNILEELEKLKRERSQTSPFSSLEEFENWSDSVRPLLSFSKELSTAFAQSVTGATVTARMGSPEDSKTNMNNAIGILNQAITAAKLRNQEASEPKSFSSQNNEKKSMKEQFENHPVVFGCSLLLAGFLAGVSFMSFVFPSLTTAPELPAVVSKENIECNIDGLPLLSESHDKRVSVMQSQLLEFESKASDRMIISSYQEKYLDSANRVREDIKTEKIAFSQAVNQLHAKCQEMHNKSKQQGLAAGTR